MKAKEYAEQMLNNITNKDDNKEFTTAAKKIIVAMLMEVKTIYASRNGNSDSAFAAVVLEQQQKWRAVCRIVNGNKLKFELLEDAFLNAIYNVSPGIKDYISHTRNIARR